VLSWGHVLALGQLDPQRQVAIRLSRMARLRGTCIGKRRRRQKSSATKSAALSTLSQKTFWKCTIYLNITGGYCRSTSPLLINYFFCLFHLLYSDCTFSQHNLWIVCTFSLMCLFDSTQPFSCWFLWPQSSCSLYGWTILWVRLYCCTVLTLIYLFIHSKLFIHPSIHLFITHTKQQCTSVYLPFLRHILLWSGYISQKGTSILLADIDAFSKFFHCWIRHEICNKVVITSPNKL